jgi:hypothetical protein
MLVFCSRGEDPLMVPPRETTAVVFDTGNALSWNFYTITAYPYKLWAYFPINKLL